MLAGLGTDDGEAVKASLEVDLPTVKIEWTSGVVAEKLTGRC